jgi:broad specificity phosphatase PhoE
MITTLYLVRHATPDWSRTDIRYDIPPGPPLTEQGESEAAALGEFLRQVGAQKIYYSPLERTRRTAELAATIAQIPYLEEKGIAEWVRGESEQEVLGRVLPALESAAAESREEGAIALVTHGGPIRIALEALGADSATLKHYRKVFDRDNPLPPAGVWRLTREQATTGWGLELLFTPQPYPAYVPQTVHV